MGVFRIYTVAGVILGIWMLGMQTVKVGGPDGMTFAAVAETARALGVGMMKACVIAALICLSVRVLGLDRLWHWLERSMLDTGWGPPVEVVLILIWMLIVAAPVAIVPALAMAWIWGP